MPSVTFSPIIPFASATLSAAERQRRYYQGIYDRTIGKGQEGNYSITPLDDGSGWSLLAGVRGSRPFRILKNGSVQERTFMALQFQEILPPGSLTIGGGA